MTRYTIDELEPRIGRIARRKLDKMLGQISEEMSCLEMQAIFSLVCMPYAMARFARRLWVRGHDIEGFPCPRVGYRLTGGPLIG